MSWKHAGTGASADLKLICEQILWRDHAGAVPERKTAVEADAI